MWKTALALSFVALAGDRAGRSEVEPLLLKEERMFIEYTASANEATVVVEAESESGLSQVEVMRPDGRRVLSMGTREGLDTSLSGFVIESREGTYEALRSIYTEGVYQMRARTDDGLPVRGSALLSHALCRPPVVLQPLEGQSLPTTFQVTWVPDPAASAYQVILEQNENDGLSVTLPPGSESFQVPVGVLRPDTETLVEVGAIAPNGNRTLVEVAFRTL